MTATTDEDDFNLPDLISRESIFERSADWVSEAMGRPNNIMIWFVIVVGWTLLFALNIVNPAGTFLPSWFTSQGYNFPLNLVTTVAELFIGFLVAAAANRSQRVLSNTLTKIITLITKVGTLEKNLRAEISANTALTQEVHAMATTIVAQTALLKNIHEHLDLISNTVGAPTPVPKPPVKLWPYTLTSS